MLSKVLFAFSLFLICTASFAAQLKPFTATYQVVKFDLLLGEIEAKLEADDNRLIYSKKSRTRGLAALFRNESIMEKSTLLLTKERLLVLDYTYRLQRGDEVRENSFVFEAPDQVKGIFKNQPFSIKVPQGALDRSSIELALMQDAGPNETTLSYSLIDKNKLKSYNFKYLGKQTVETPAGVFSCFDYKVIRESGKRSTTLCLAPTLNNLPVKITHNEKGTEFYMVLKSHNH